MVAFVGTGGRLRRNPHLNPIDDLLRRLQLSAADRLERFLDIAALCGENVPADLVLRFMEVSEAEREELLERVDLDLVENANLSIFVDHQYGHPSFPGVLVYSFLSPVLSLGLLEELSRDRRNSLALEFLKYLQRVLPVSTRGVARLFLSLANHVADPDRREGYLRELGWWISLEQADELTERVVEDLKSSDVEPQTLLDLVYEAKYRWPPVHRTAILRGLEQSGSELSPEEAVKLHTLRADLFIETHHPAEALSEGQLAVELAEVVHGPRDRAFTNAVILTGIALKLLGKLGPARDAFQKVLSISLFLYGARHELVANAHHHLGLALTDLGDFVGARQHLSRALEIEREMPGSAVRIARILVGLAKSLAQLDETADAIVCLEEAYRIDCEVCGEEHFVTGEDLANLGALYIFVNNDEQAVEPLDKALEIFRSYYGESSVETFQALYYLASAHVIREPTVAIEYLEHALPIASRLYGEESVQASRVRSILAALHQGMIVKPVRAASLFDRLK